MGRELKRKNKSKVVEVDTSINLITLLKITFFVILILLVIYYILAVFITKEIDISSKSDNDIEEISGTNNTVTNKILASNIFEQKESSYYVYFYNFSDNDNLYSLISSSLDDKIYRVDTSSGLNAKYVVSENGNKAVTDINDLKVVNNTLVKVDNDKIIEYYEGKNNIMNVIRD